MKDVEEEKDRKFSTNMKIYSNWREVQIDKIVPSGFVSFAILVGEQGEYNLNGVSREVWYSGTYEAHMQGISKLQKLLSSWEIITCEPFKSKQLL